MKKRYENDDNGKTTKVNTKNELLDHLESVHTTELGQERIRKNLLLETNDVVEWCKTKIQSSEAGIVRNGKNWYVHADNCIITVNAYSYTIITAHKRRERTNHII